MFSNETTGDKISPILRVAPIAADAVALVLHILFLPILTAYLSDRSAGNVIILAVAYLVFCTAVYLIQKLEPASGSPLLPRLLQSKNVRIVLGILFGVVMMLVISIQLGYLDALLVADPRELGEGGSVAFYVLAPGAWLGFSLFYTLILASEFETTIRRDTPAYPALALATLLDTNLMLLLFTAQGRAIAQANIGDETGLLLFPLVYILLLLLFGPVRWLYLARRPRLEGLVTFLALVGYATWQILASAPLP